MIQPSDVQYISNASVILTRYCTTVKHHILYLMVHAKGFITHWWIKINQSDWILFTEHLTHFSLALSLDLRVSSKIYHTLGMGALTEAFNRVWACEQQGNHTFMHNVAPILWSVLIICCISISWVFSCLKNSCTWMVVEKEHYLFYGFPVFIFLRQPFSFLHVEQQLTPCHCFSVCAIQTGPLASCMGDMVSIDIWCPREFICDWHISEVPFVDRNYLFTFLGRWTRTHCTAGEDNLDQWVTPNLVWIFGDLIIQ